MQNYHLSLNFFIIFGCSCLWGFCLVLVSTFFVALIEILYGIFWSHALDVNLRPLDTTHRNLGPWVKINMRKDLFGYENQGIKYEIYRPSYPSAMVQKAMQHVKAKSKYLDVATGTGKILFQLHHHFEQSTGLDLSKKMIDVCQERVKELGLTSIELECEDFMTAQIEQKFDLITIGQALHWLKIKQFLIKAKELLVPEGVLAVYGYILDGLEGQTPEETKFLSQLFTEFYDKRVKPNHDFPVDDLHTHYSNQQKYPFEQIFPKVSRELIRLAIPMDKNGVISYVKTFSGYNTYQQRFPEQKDPILILQQNVPATMKITSIFYYFSIICSK